MSGSALSYSRGRLGRRLKVSGVSVCKWFANGSERCGWCSVGFSERKFRGGSAVTWAFALLHQKNVPGFREIRSKPLRARAPDLDVCNSRMSHEGEGCAVCCANCADRSRSWRLEASRALLGGIRREIRVDRARRLRVTGGGPRSFPVWVSQPVMRLRPEGPGASLFAGAGAGRTIGSCQHRCGCDNASSAVISTWI